MSKLKIIDRVLSYFYRVQPKQESNNSIKFFGDIILVKHTGNLRGVTYLQENILYISGIEESFSKKIDLYLKQSLMREIKLWISYYEKIMGVKARKISVRLNKTRWGSCNSKGDLSFNLRLVYLPIECLKYVIVHELAHILEMNHSKNFWKIVETTYPNYKKIRASLKYL